MVNRRTIYVYADWLGIEGPVLMGELYSELLRGKEVFSFEYEKEWINSSHAQLLDPELQLYKGLQYLKNDKSNFGLFLDSSPDRWGKVLMKRREAALAREEQREQKTLFETDYLLGVYDGHRMGALRFKTDKDGPFLNDNKDMTTPPFTSIRELAALSLKVEDDDLVDDPEYLKWLTLLIAPGSSLGGARPKASVVDPQGDLWIAKFPSKNDEGDIGGWELVTYNLALKAGLKMAECRAEKHNSNYHTFLTRRFDRREGGKRIHFASAMTMLGHTDGYDSTEGASYLEMLEFLESNGAKVKEDLQELWRRIVFSICISNTDDHLRNHGFLLTSKGWVLSPAYDLNPNEDGLGLSLNINETDNSLNLDLAMEVHEYFRYSEPEAIKTMKEVKSAVKSWRDMAKSCGISNTDQELKAKAFKLADL
ncbi:MAG: HipA domain-containing protein [Vicingaceae bacterium]